MVDVTTATVGSPGRSTAGAPWWFGWCLTRVVVVALTYLTGDAIAADPRYYLMSLARTSSDGWGAVLPEYPLPVALAMWPLHVVGSLGVAAWVVVLVPLLAIDLAFTRSLHRGAGREAVRCWTTGVLLLGPLALQRLDLVAGVLLASALLSRRAPVTGWSLALGTATKLFPLLALAVVAGTDRRPTRVVAWTLVPGVALAVVCLVIGGWDRLVSPLRYQSSRGLQVESVAATPFLGARRWDETRWPVDFAASRSWEVRGPGTETALALATATLTIGLLGLVAAMVALACRTRRARGRRREPGGSRAGRTAVAAWGTLSVVCLLVVTSKVLSPQYMVWLLPVLAAALAEPSRALRRWSRWLMLALLLTQPIFPLLYGGLTGETWATWPATVVVVTRNLVLLGLTVEAVRQTVRAARAWG